MKVCIETIIIIVTAYTYFLFMWQTTYFCTLSIVKIMIIFIYVAIPNTEVDNIYDHA